jgi:hypothetical protein
MKQLEKYFTQDELNELAGKPKLLEKLHTHLSNPLYKEANFNWQRTQLQQIIKGAEKYNEPLNPASWTGQQLIEHAMQENIDQAHYLTALGEKVKELEKALQKANSDTSYWRKRYTEVKHELTELENLTVNVATIEFKTNISIDSSKVPNLKEFAESLNNATLKLGIKK